MERRDRTGIKGKDCTSFKEVNTKVYFDSSTICAGIRAVLLWENNTVNCPEIITSEVDTCTQI